MKETMTGLGIQIPMSSNRHSNNLELRVPSRVTKILLNTLDSCIKANLDVNPNSNQKDKNTSDNDEAT